MTLSALLVQRRALLQQARLANLAFAYDKLNGFAQRIARARLTGEVRLQQADPDLQRYCPSLTALQGSQSVIEEHFDDEDVLDLADVLAYVTGDCDIDVSFRLEELNERFIMPVHQQLSQEGVVIDHVEHPAALFDDGAPTDYTHHDDPHRNSP